MTESGETKYQAYLDYRAELVRGRQAAMESYDKAIIAVTTTLLGLSLKPWRKLPSRKRRNRDADMGAGP